VTERKPITPGKLKPSIPTLEKEKQNPIPFKEMGSKSNYCPYPPHGSEIISQGLPAWKKEYKFILKMSRRIKKSLCFRYHAA